MGQDDRVRFARRRDAILYHGSERAALISVFGIGVSVCVGLGKFLKHMIRPDLEPSNSGVRAASILIGLLTVVLVSSGMIHRWTARKGDPGLDGVRSANLPDKPQGKASEPNTVRNT